MYRVARLGVSVAAWSDMARHDKAWRGSRGSVWTGGVSPDVAWQGMAGMARLVATRLIMARQDEAVEVRRVYDWPGSAGWGLARQAWYGMVGVTRRSVAWLGKARFFMMQIPKIVVIKVAGKWHIKGPWPEPFGPYLTKVDAEDVCRGLIRTYKYHRQPGFITCDEPERKRERL